MVRRHHQFKVDDLSRFLVYILGHRPDEFGLAPDTDGYVTYNAPDTDGYVTYKELLQAIHEEAGWHYVRKSHINEVLLGKDRGLFQADDKRIRVFDIRWQMNLEDAPQPVPKTLFAPIRRKAHPVVMEKGLKSSEGRYQVLCADKDMALRIGKRRDQKPVLLEILASEAESKG
ncbi:MAG: hypothetical protein JRJ38_20340, partial [Deltaproteobacteria bacterium]|nr:hypothetical protein [Deltaproteobacteria bacterium]